MLTHALTSALRRRMRPGRQPERRGVEHRVTVRRHLALSRYRAIRNSVREVTLPSDAVQILVGD